MGNAKLYSTHDIETLKEKLAAYKDTLTTLKTGDSAKDYLFMKEEFNGFKTKITDLEELMEIMDEEQSMQIKEYKQEIKSFSTQVDSLNQTVEELNQKISSITNKMKDGNSNNPIETKPPIALQGFLNTRMNDNIKETFQPKGQSSFPSIPKSNLPRSFKKIQEIVNRSQSIEELPADLTPTETFTFQKNLQDKPHNFSKQNTPLNDMNLSQLNNGLHKNVNPKSPGMINRHVPTKRISIICVETKPFSMSETVPVNTDTTKESFNKEQNVATIEKAEEQNIPSIEKEENTMQEKVDRIEISNDVKQQESKNKDPLSILKFFWKRN